MISRIGAGFNYRPTAVSSHQSTQDQGEHRSPDVTDKSAPASLLCNERETYTGQMTTFRSLLSDARQTPTRI
jgi:hypothetical protein